MSTVSIETAQNTIAIEITATEAVLNIVAQTVVVETTGGGTLLPGDIVDGLNAADEPNADNPFATMNDVLAYALMMGA